MKSREIPYYIDYVSENLLSYLKKEATPVAGIPDLFEIGKGGGLESTQSLKFMCELYDQVKNELNAVLSQRVLDRNFLDARTKACFELNEKLKIPFTNPDYETVLGHEDGKGRIVAGPLDTFYCKASGRKSIAELPEFLKGPHVTLFGPPDDAKLSINAMNAYHRKLKNEPAIVSELLSTHTSVPKWGADDEDSKTPLRRDLVEAGKNLTDCMKGDLSFTDASNGKTYRLESHHRSLPIKRFPGLALPSTFLLYRDNPIPLHIYDFALHLFENWRDPKAVSFYVPKLETSDEARYIHKMVKCAETLIKKAHPEYQEGTVRLFIVLENPRAIFRANEIMDELHPYFAGASLGWHDYLASTARLFREDSNYRIPVKADPDIVIKYIKASHELLAQVVGTRGGIKIGGMYGVLPIDSDPKSPSFQLTIKGFIKDVVTQMKRGLSGYWIAHPDFVRIGIAIVEAWKLHESGKPQKLEELATSLLDKKYHDEILKFIRGKDISGLNPDDPMHKRALIVADIKESSFIANNAPEEIRYNVFQSLQYLTDWLCGNGCVALPAQIEGVPVRVMDDLATAERSRWEVWHEIRHGRFSLEEFLKIAHEEMTFIRKDRSDEKKIVQVKWDERTEKWYPVAFNLMVKLMTAKNPPEFATELLMPFTVESLRKSKDPWAALSQVDVSKYALDPYIERFNFYFSLCGSLRFAKEMASGVIPNLPLGQRIVKSFKKDEIIEAASFHGDIGENKNTLDETASKEQASVLKEDEKVKDNLRSLGAEYKKKFGIKFLISAQGKSAFDIMSALKKRMSNSESVELDNARDALWEIALKRFNTIGTYNLAGKIQGALEKLSVVGAQLAIVDHGREQSICFGDRFRETNATATTACFFELASLSKSLASCFAIEYFKKKNIPLSTPINELFKKTSSKFRIKSKNPDWAERVTIIDLMSHTALNLHYVNGVPADRPMPKVHEFLEGNEDYGYEPVECVNEPGKVFKYSGGGFLVLEHLIESLEKSSIQNITHDFFEQLGLDNLTFEQEYIKNIKYAHGHLDDGTKVEGTRKMFPAFAAGATGTAQDMTRFLRALTDAFHNPKGHGPISHDTAVLMLYGTDKGSVEFMGTKMGLGIFTIEAGANRFAIHQGANDGFRSIFVHCYDGPDRDTGFTILCNGDNNAMLFITQVAQLLLKELKVQGVDTSKFRSDFEMSGIPQEQIVNQGYEKLVFSAFEADLPNQIIDKGPPDALAKYNLAVGGKILSSTNQRFARGENLLSDHEPKFDPELYERQGKTMDSWESVRHNQNERDDLVFELKRPSNVQFVSLSTKYHFGNQAPAVSVEGRETNDGPWKVIVPKVSIEGHSSKHVLSQDGKTKFKYIRASMYPDGGFSRLGLFSEDLPQSERSKFQSSAEAKSIPFDEKIPHSQKPLAPKYVATEKSISSAWGRLASGEEVDVASAAFGGKIVSASNEHYGPATQIISPYPPLHMFDGFESARSRKIGHSEYAIVALGRTSTIHRVEIDFTFFRNNNPLDLSLDGLTSKQKWVTIKEKTRVKPYAGNVLAFDVSLKEPLEQIRINVFPDGGINRIRIYSRA